MNPPIKSESTSTNSKNGASTQAAPAPAPAPAIEKPKGAQKPVTIQLSDDVHRKLRMVAMSKGATTSGLVESYVDAALKRDLVLVIAKLTDE